MKVAPSNGNITTGTCSSKVASTHIYCFNNVWKQSSIDLETNDINMARKLKTVKTIYQRKNRKLHIF